MSRSSIVLLKNDNGILPLLPTRSTSHPLGVPDAHPPGVSRVKLAVIGWGANDSYAPLGNYMGCGHDAWGETSY